MYLKEIYWNLTIGQFNNRRKVYCKVRQRFLKVVTIRTMITKQAFIFFFVNNYQTLLYRTITTKSWKVNYH